MGQLCAHSCNAAKTAGARSNAMRSQTMRRGALLATVALAIASSGCHKSAAAATPTITITPTSATIEAGTTEQFGDTVTNESTTAVTWYVNGVAGGDAATGIGTISATGLYQAPEVPTPAAGEEVTVTVELTADSTLFAAAGVVITPIPVVTISPTTATLAAAVPSVTFPFSVALFGLNTNPPTSPAVTWEVNNVIGGNSTLGTIDQNGNYTPPQVPPPGGIVVVNVYLDADTTQSAGAAVTLNYGPASAQGSYAFSMAGQNAAGFFARAGQLTFSGAGALSGVEDVHAAGTAAAPEAAFTGTYTIGIDGRGTASFSDGTNYYLTVVSANQIRLAEADSSATAHGQADLQTASAFTDASISGGYAFDFFGTSGAALATSEIGQFTATGAGATLQNGLEDQNAGGTLTSAAPFTGTYSAINTTTGRGTATIIGINGTTTYAFYLVSATELRIIETDASADLVGDALHQSGTANAGFLSALTVFQLTGRSTAGKVAAAGLFLADGSGGSPTSFSGGLLDENNNGTVTPSEQFTGTYSVAGTGRGTASFTPSGQPAMSFVMYFVQAGQAIIQETDSSAVAHGVMDAQGIANGFSTASLTGSFALNWTGAAPPLTAEQDATGQLTVGHTAAVVSGTWDRNNALVLQPGITLTGSYFLAGNGRGTITLTDAASVKYDLAAYVVNPNTVFLVDTDPTLVLSGQLTRQY